MEKRNTGRILGAILGGAIAAMAVGLLLSPLVRISFELVWESGVGSFMILIPIAITWLFLSMYFGGYTASRIAFQNEYHITWTVIGIAILVFFAYGRRFHQFNIGLLVISLSVGIVGALAGCHSGIQYKEKRKKHTGQRFK